MKSCVQLYNEAFPEDSQTVPDYFVREKQDEGHDWTIDQVNDWGREALQEWFAVCFVCPTEQLNGLRTDKSEFETVNDFIQFTTDRLAVDRTRYEFLAAAMVTITNISRYTQALEAKLEKASAPRMSAEQFQQMLAQQENQHREWCDMQEKWHNQELTAIDGKETITAS